MPRLRVGPLKDNDRTGLCRGEARAGQFGLGRRNLGDSFANSPSCGVITTGPERALMRPNSRSPLPVNDVRAIGVENHGGARREGDFDEVDGILVEAKCGTNDDGIPPLVGEDRAEAPLPHPSAAA